MNGHPPTNQHQPLVVGGPVNEQLLVITTHLEDSSRFISLRAACATAFGHLIAAFEHSPSPSILAPAPPPARGLVPVTGFQPRRGGGSDADGNTTPSPRGAAVCSEPNTRNATRPGPEGSRTGAARRSGGQFTAPRRPAVTGAESQPRAELSPLVTASGVLPVVAVLPKTCCVSAGLKPCRPWKRLSRAVGVSVSRIVASKISQQLCRVRVEVSRRHGVSQTFGRHCRLTLTS